MYFFLALLYIVIGTLLAIPYCLLSGWSFVYYQLMIFTTPVMMFIWLAAATAAVIRRIGLWLFWSWTFYCLIPAIIHRIAAPIIGAMGYRNFALDLDAHRYVALADVVFFTTALACLCMMVMVLLNGAAMAYHETKTWIQSHFGHGKRS